MILPMYLLGLRELSIDPAPVSLFEILFGDDAGDSSDSSPVAQGSYEGTVPRRASANVSDLSIAVPGALFYDLDLLGKQTE